MIMGKFKQWAPRFTELMDPPQRDRIIASSSKGGNYPVGRISLDSEGEWRDKWRVIDEELRDAMKRMRAKQRTPGPNGVPDRAWAAARVVIVGHLRQVFDDCGVFPGRGGGQN